MIDAKALLADLKQRVKELVEDLRERCAEHPELELPLREEFAKAKERARTAQPYEEWRESLLTQIAVAWVLGCVFVRFLEDNELVDASRLAGSGARLALARDHEEHFFQQHPKDTVREYLLAVFSDVARLPALGPLFDRGRNPLFLLGPSADTARALLDFWRRTDPSRESVALVHDFADASRSTRFLGDLYQDLSEEAKSRYALLQTPVFVEEFLLDRTLEPAIGEFGFREVRLIDPACGSGHFLLGAFERLFDRHVKAESASEPRVLAQRALDQVAGVDLNPFAVAIARFRLLLAALAACQIKRLREAPDFKMHVATGDSLLHGTRPHMEGGIQRDYLDDPLEHHHYATEDAVEVERLLARRYHVVVGNPPYPTVKDAAANQLYRERFGSCYRQYSIAVPFTERFFDLAIAPSLGELSPAGLVGMITANSFMKREFGKKLVEKYIPRWDMTHVIDTQFARIPGHDTPTVILLGKCRIPVESSIRTVMGIRGEQPTDGDAAMGNVWRSIVELLDRPGMQSDFVSVDDVRRERFEKHPWSIGGAGAADLKEGIDEAITAVLRDVCDEIGFGAVTREDEAFRVSRSVALRHRIGDESIRPLVAGEEVRDWSIDRTVDAVWPYNAITLEATNVESIDRFLWPWRRQLADRIAYGSTQVERGLEWFEYSMFFRNRFRIPLSIAFAEVATHNHFVLDRGRKVFNRTAPVIKLPPGASEDDHLGLLGLLNSSTAGFWLRQACHNKGLRGEGGGTTAEGWEQFHQFIGTRLLEFPTVRETPLDPMPGSLGGSPVWSTG